MRLILFYHRFRNQYRIHKRWASLWTITRLAWAQSKRKKEYEINGTIKPIQN